MEVHYLNTSYPYNSAGSFMEYFEGLTYEHVNFIFDGASHVQVLLLKSLPFHIGLTVSFMFIWF